MEITELRRPSILVLVLGIILTLIGFTMLLNPQDDNTNMIFLSIFGIGMFMFGLGFSVLYQIRKINHK